MKEWDEIAAKLPSGMSSEHYDQIRNAYYKQKIVPKIQPGEDPVATYNSFLSQSERTSYNLGKSAVNTALVLATAELPGAALRPVLGAFGASGAVARIASGGAAFATYNALEAKDGDRVAAGIRGAVAGSLIETGMGALLGFGEKAIHKTVADSLSNAATPEVNKTVAEAVVNDVKEAKAQGYTTGPIEVNPSIKGVLAVTKDAQGVPTIHHVPRGKESDVIGLVEEVLGNGGSLDAIHTNPASQPRALEFMKHFADKGEAKAATTAVHTVPGKAAEVASDLNANGVQAIAVGDSKVKAGPVNDVVDAAHASELADKAKAATFNPPDDISKTMIRLGELRNESRMAGMNRAKYAEMHHLAGEVGGKYGLTRAQAGQIGLRYWEQSAQEGAQTSVTDMLERYRGAGKEFGAEEGFKPPAGFDLKSRLPGLRAPASERVMWDTDPLQVPGEIRVRPTGTTKVTGKHSTDLGWVGAQVTSDRGPMRVLARDATAGDVYHEAIHDGLEHSDLHETVRPLSGEHKSTLMDIADGLRSVDVYKGNPDHTMYNEAFTHAAEAVRMGDTNKLEELARWDTSVDRVKQMVNTTAGRAWEASLTRDNAPLRAFQRRMQDLVRRTSEDVSHELGKAQKFGYTTWFDPELNQFVMRDGEGRELLKKDLNAVWDHIDGADPSTHFPDVANKAYFKGIRGPLVPPGTEPVDGTTTLEWDSPVPFGAQAVLSISRPTLDWAASIQKTLGKYGIDMDFYGAFADADRAAKKAGPLMDKLKGETDAILKGVPGAKRADYGEVLARDEADWPAMQQALNLSSKDMANIRGLKEWDAKHVTEGGTGLVDALKQIRKVREAGGDIARAIGKKTPVGEAIRNGALGYSDLNVGNVRSWAIRDTMENLHLRDPLKAIEDLAKTRTNSGSLLLQQIQYPIQNYLRYMRGIPDASQSLLNSFVNGMTSAASKRIAQLNTHLPEALRLPTDFGAPKQLMAKFQLLQYTAGLGARPAVFIRDTFQAMQAAAIMGPSAFAEGLAKALTPEGRALADAAGAMIKGRNVSEVLGEVTKDLPASSRISDAAVKMADKLMAPSRIGHNIGRTIAFLGEYSRALREIPKFRAGEISAKDLSHATGLWFQDEAPMQRILEMARDSKVPVEEVAKEFGLAMNDSTQFALRSGTQGAGLRTGMGRVFGQYGTWPMNYIEFVRKLTQRAIENPAKGVPAMVGWAAMNYGAFAAAQSVGIDAAKWLFFSPAGYAGSPNLELLQNIMTAPEESIAGLEARKKLHEVPFEFIPAGVEIDDIIKAIDGGETNIPQLLGFRVLKPQDQKDFEDWLLTEGGFTGKSKRDIEDYFSQ